MADACQLLYQYVRQERSPGFHRDKNGRCVPNVKILPPKDRSAAAAITTTKHTTIRPVNPIGFKFLYAKENHKLEIHMELEWTPK